MFAGHVMLGLTVSMTVTVDVHDVLSLKLFVAVQVMVLVPSGNVDGDDGEQLGVNVPSTTSEAVAVYDAIAAGEPPDVCRVCAIGHVIDGGVF